MSRGESTFFFFFFFNDTATTEIYTLSLHDALPILDTPLWDAVPQGPDRSRMLRPEDVARAAVLMVTLPPGAALEIGRAHAELQSQSNLVCRLLLEKKKNKHDLATSLPFAISHGSTS